MAIVKIRLKSGTREIELDGEMEDVESLLARWWASANGADEAIEESDLEQSQSERRSKGPKKRGRQPRASASSSSNPPDPSRDPNTIANAVKEDKDFARFHEKIIVADSSVYHKIAFVCWFVGKPLTSGDIYRALIALNIKIDLPRVSKGLKKNIGCFITSAQRSSGGPPADYKLTEKAKTEFTSWLMSNAE